MKLMNRRVVPTIGLVLLAVAAASAPGRASAQSTDDLHLPEALDRALRKMMDDLKPALNDALDFMRSFKVIDDPRHYEMPEVLPNGDILIRRRDDAPPYVPEAPDEDEAQPLPAEPARPEPAPPEEGIRT